MANTLRRFKGILSSYFYLAPGLFFLSFLLLAMFGVVQYSFWTWTVEKRTQEIFTFDNYVKFFMDPFYIGCLLLTFKIGAEVAIFGLLLGYPLAYFIARSSSRRVRTVLTFSVLTPLLTNVLVLVYGWIVLLSSTGLINRLLLSIGLIQSPLNLLFNETCIVIGLTHELLPFVTLPIAGVIGAIDKSLEESAKMLGANRFQVLLRVTLPLSAPGILAGSILCFTLVISSFVEPILLGGGNVYMLGVLIQQSMLLTLNWPFASAISVVLAVLTLVFIASYNRVIAIGVS